MSESQADRHVIVVPDFFDGAGELRRALDSRFAPSDTIGADRFVWDYWHVPDLFTYLRALPQVIFPDDLLQTFLRRLVAWGRENLACRSALLPMLNCHLDGCLHNFHTDSENGPWAYVFSLTEWDERAFAGGETLLLDPNVADFWRASRGGRNRTTLFASISPRWNQLSVFDARLPHCVRRVEGAHDPLHGRLTMVGWFVDPGVTVSNEADDDLLTSLTELREAIDRSLEDVHGVAGFVVVRVDVGLDSTAVARVTVNSLVPTAGEFALTTAVAEHIRGRLDGVPLPLASDDAWGTLAFQLRSS